MDYFQGVVTEYLRADRSVFVNTECRIQLEPGNPPAKGRHWYCDVVAVNLRESSAFLCEITFSSNLHALLRRLTAWAAEWPLVRKAPARDCAISIGATQMPPPRVTYLESVVPWKYRSWNWKADYIEGKPD